MNITIQIDPSCINDLKWVLEFILQQQPSMKQYADEFYQNQKNETSSISEAIKQLTDKIDEVKKDVNRQSEEPAKKEEIIRKYEAEIADYKTRISNCVNREKDLSATIEKNEEDHKAKIKKLEDDYREYSETANKEKGEMQEEFSKKISDKDKEINKLKKQLETCSINYGSDDPTRKDFFKVSGDVLTQTQIQSALYVANKSGEQYKYTINKDGFILKACENMERELEPFCEIVECDNGANDIDVESVGLAKLHGLDLEIIQKAKIKLIKR